MVRHVTLLAASDLVNDVELRTPDLHAWVEHPVRRADERLLEVNRVVHDRHDGEEVSVPDETLGHRRLVAVRDAVALQPSSFQMRGEHRERVTVPSRRREACPRVRGMRGRMRPSVEPQHARRLTERAEQLVSDRLLRDRIELSSDADIGRPAQ